MPSEGVPSVMSNCSAKNVAPICVVAYVSKRRFGLKGYQTPELNNSCEAYYSEDPRCRPLGFKSVMKLSYNPRSGQTLLLLFWKRRKLTIRVAGKKKLTTFVPRCEMQRRF
jgi:hypothetical protein